MLEDIGLQCRASLHALIPPHIVRHAFPGIATQMSRQAVFNPTWALPSEQIYFVDDALLTHIARETFSIFNIWVCCILLRLWKCKGCLWPQQHWAVIKVSFLAETKVVKVHMGSVGGAPLMQVSTVIPWKHSSGEMMETSPCAS